MKKTVFVLGGCRSGKSRHALETAETFPGSPQIFVATCVPHDEEMQVRVTRHRRERSRNWQTIETPILLPEVITENSRRAAVLLIDCLTLWISNLLMAGEDEKAIQRRIEALTRAMAAAECPLVMVSNEVGGGIVPDNQLARQFRDLVGSANQAVAGAAKRVVWMVAGIPVTVKG